MGHKHPIAYHHVEQRWKSAATEVRQIINLLKQTMTQNDDSANTAISRARSSVQGIG